MAIDFSNLGIENEKSAVDVLNELYSKNSINFHTELSMKQIKVLCKIYYMKKRKEFPEKSAWEIMNDTMEYYKQLKTSYKRRRPAEIIKGLSELKDEYLEESIEKSKRK